MFESNQDIYYIDGDFKIKEGVFKGYVRITSSCPPIINLYDNHLKENILINEDYVFNTLEEAKEFLDED
jgi:hypothetical protein